MDILQNPNFISWFGDSKVVDDAGLPLRCYHVTKAGGFTAFKFSGIGIHFGSKPEQSNKRLDSISREKGTTNPSMYVCYLRIVNPLYIEDTQSDNEPETVATIIGDSCKEQNEELSYALFDLSAKIEKYMEEVYARNTAVQDSSKAIQKCLKSIVTLIQHYGYDGLIYENEWEGEGISYCVFSPFQIKSAYSNTGKYSKRSRNINENTLKEYCLKTIYIDRNGNSTRVNIMKNPTPEEIILLWKSSQETGLKFIADSETKELIAFRGDITSHGRVARELGLPYNTNSRYFYGSSEKRPEMGKMIDISNYGFMDIQDDIDRFPEKINAYIELCNKNWSWLDEYIDMVSFTKEKQRILRYVQTKKRKSIDFTEAINYGKYNEILSPHLFEFLCDIDPTLDRKYAVWIIRCFMKDFRIPQLLDALEVLKKEGHETYEGRARDHIITYHPLSYGGAEQLGYFYDKRLVRFLQEDYPKVTEDLKKYTKLKNKKLLSATPEGTLKDTTPLYNIMNIKSFRDLSQLIDVHRYQLEEIEAKEPIDPTEAEKWYEDSQWLVVRPLTMKAACKYGANTKWCTTYTDPGMNKFNYYNNKGPLIIIIKKHPTEVGGTQKYSTPDKWQIHLESNQWMDEEDEDVGNHTKFANALPKPISNAIYEHTKAFVFAPDKKKIVVEICTNPEKFEVLKSKLALKSFTSAMIDSDIENLTDILDDKFYYMAFNDTYWEDAAGNDAYSYKYGYDNPWEFLKDTEPALLSEADPCSYCDGTGYAIYAKDNDNDWTTELDENQYATALGKLQSDYPNLVNEFISVYGKKREDGTYIPMDDTAMEVLAQKIGNKCRFCKGTGMGIDKNDIEAWSEEQREEAAQESESQAADDSLKEWANEFSSEWKSSNYRNKVEKMYDMIVKEFLNMEQYPKETITTVLNLVLLFSLSDDTDFNL
jgi:hypothetical protein